MRLLALISLIALNFCSINCGGSRSYVKENHDRGPYWSKSMFAEAYSAFEEQNYELARQQFAAHMAKDSAALDFHGYGFLAECYKRLGQLDSGRAVYSKARQFYVSLKLSHANDHFYAIALDKLAKWEQNYPEFPAELRKENGFVPYNEPPTPEGGWNALARNLRYPESVRRAGIEGEVRVQVLIDENGEPTKFEVKQSLTPACDRAAIAAIKRTKFKPAKLKGKKSKAWVMLPVQFRLR